MKVIFDHGVPRPLAAMLQDCEVVTARAMGWDLLANGKLLAAAINAGFAVMVTTDRNMVHQQNVARLPIGLVALSRNDWRRIRACRAAIELAIAVVQPGHAVEVHIG